jgi:tRNA uridine 5-carboxymethylaminomethyl modification enzyme
VIGAERAERLVAKEAAIEATKEQLRRLRSGETTLEQRLRRPETSWRDLLGLQASLREVSAEVAEQVVCDIKYAGYIHRQQQQIQRQHRLAEKRIPEGFDYQRLRHLRTEAREKLARIRPVTLAQASRISGITPSDVALLLAHREGGPPPPA